MSEKMTKQNIDESACAYNNTIPLQFSAQSPMQTPQKQREHQSQIEKSHNRRSVSASIRMSSMRSSMRRASITKFVGKMLHPKRKSKNNMSLLGCAPRDFNEEMMYVGNAGTFVYTAASDVDSVSSGVSSSDVSRSTRYTTASGVLGIAQPSYAKDNEDPDSFFSQGINVNNSILGFEKNNDNNGNSGTDKNLEHSTILELPPLDETMASEHPLETTQSNKGPALPSIEPQSLLLDESAHSVYSQDSITRFMHRKTSIIDPRGTHESAANYQYVNKRNKNKELTKIFVLLLHFQSRKFELTQIEFLRKKGTIGTILESIPVHAVELVLGFQTYRGLCRPTDGIEMCDKNVLAAERHGWRIRKGEVLVAIPEGYTGEECKIIWNKKLVNHKKLQMLLGRSDPLRKVKKSSSTSRSNSNRSRTDSNASSIVLDEIAIERSMIAEDEEEELNLKDSSQHSTSHTNGFHSHFDHHLDDKQPPTTQETATNNETRIVRYKQNTAEQSNNTDSSFYRQYLNEEDILVQRETTTATHHDGTLKTIQTMMIVPRSPSASTNNIFPPVNDVSVKILTALVASMSPFGAQGIVMGATFYAIVNYMRQNNMIPLALNNSSPPANNNTKDRVDAYDDSIYDIPELD